jgi:hypothetical protein
MSRFDRVVAIGDQRRIEADAGPAQRRPIALIALLGGARIGTALDEGDAPMKRCSTAVPTPPSLSMPT